MEAMSKTQKKVVKRLHKVRSMGSQLQGLRPFNGNLNNIKMSKERCHKIRQFLIRQSKNSGRSISDILSQSISQREASS